MNDIIRHIKDQITEITKKALLEMKVDLAVDVEIEIPKDKTHGDFSINTAMKLTKILKMPPRDIAKSLLFQKIIDIYSPLSLYQYLNNSSLLITFLVIFPTL